MGEVLGKIEKPQVEKYRGERKIYLVPLVYLPKEIPAELREIIDAYWQEAEQQVRGLEQKLGPAKKIYHESLAVGGDAGLSMLEKFYEKSFPMVKERVGHGATLEALEDMELFTEVMDWGNCLQVVVGHRAFEVLSRLYREASEKRYEHISRRIDQTLGSKEAGLLFIREDHGVQFPQDIQVFYVSPPSLDKIHRFIREKIVRRQDDRG
ncbi:hypothetical protein [Desulfovirgula thermocuniculi]|uniref:hypothetical protein n=1 Tax=Desulfovirgula thermocuniculi TaxID=348842 RepID=UPI0004174943|nr:hypothetical protein [Desulfovirgula thermocuniculi]